MSNKLPSGRYIEPLIHSVWERKHRREFYPLKDAIAVRKVSTQKQWDKLVDHIHLV